MSTTVEILVSIRSSSWERRVWKTEVVLVREKGTWKVIQMCMVIDFRGNERRIRAKWWARTVLPPYKRARYEAHRQISPCFPRYVQTSTSPVTCHNFWYLTCWKLYSFLFIIRSFYSENLFIRVIFLVVLKQFLCQWLYEALYFAVRETSLNDFIIITYCLIQCFRTKSSTKTFKFFSCVALTVFIM